MPDAQPTPVLASPSSALSANLLLSLASLLLLGGYQWTNKLEGMFKDVQLSKEMMLQFRKQSDSSSAASPAGKKESGDEVQLEVNVCTTGYWPSTKVMPGKMPKDLAAACDKYKRFYLNQHSGHKLEWRFDQGQGEIVVDFSSTCRKGLVLSTYQMMILLVFNTVKRVTYKVRHAHAHIITHTGKRKYADIRGFQFPAQRQRVQPPALPAPPSSAEVVTPQPRAPLSLLSTTTHA